MKSLSVYFDVCFTLKAYNMSQSPLLICPWYLTADLSSTE